MDYRSLVNKLEAIERGELNEATAPSTFTPTHFHKGNLGNQMPVMQAADGSFWWEGGNGEPGTSKIVPWNGDTLNRSGWNPASIDGVIENGKYVEFPEGTNWKQYQETAKKKTDATANSDAFIKEKLAKLKELMAKLEAGGKTAPTMPAQATSVEQAKALGAANPQMAQPTTTDQPGSLKVYKEGMMSKELVESFGYQTTDEGIASAALKAGGRAIPGVGLALGAKDAYDRIKAGDYTGAAIAGAGGVAGLIPGLGTAAQLGLMGVQAGRDKARTGSWLPDETEIATAANGQAPASTQAAKPAAGVDPKVKALQDKLIAAGAKIKADGIMGPATQAAMKQFPQVKESVAEGMASLRDRLAMIETEQATDEGVLDSLAKFGSQAVKGAKFGFANPTAAKNLTKPGMSMATQGGRLAGRAGAAVAKNPVKAAVGAAALGAGAGYAATPTPGGAPQAGKPAKTQGGKPTPDTPATTAVDPELIKQIQATMGELADIETPEVMAELDRARAALTKAGVQE